MRVKVDATGRVTDVAIVNDPGHGFGDAARACTLKDPFDPARDPKGRAVAAELVSARVTVPRPGGNQVVYVGYDHEEDRHLTA